jgi:hypothetical protein
MGNTNVLVFVSCVETKPDREQLTRALVLARAVCQAVDRTVDERQKARRLINIYNKIDARSWTKFRGAKFKVNFYHSCNRIQ